MQAQKEAVVCWMKGGCKARVCMYGMACVEEDGGRTLGIMPCEPATSMHA